MNGKPSNAGLQVGPVSRKDMASPPSMVLISNHLRQFLSCEPDMKSSTMTWQWHPTPQPWNPQFQFQLLKVTGKGTWEPIQGPLEQHQKVVWATGAATSKLFIGWNQRQEPTFFMEPTQNAVWTVKQTFTLMNASNLVLTTLPQIHLAPNPPLPLTQLHYQWIPSNSAATSPGMLESSIALYQAPYVVVKALDNDAGTLKVKKLKNKTLDIECVLLQLFHVKWSDDHWELEDKVDLYRSNGRHVVLQVHPTRTYVCCNRDARVKGIVVESDTIEEQCVFEFHKLPHSPLAFALRSITEHKYLGICKGQLAWVQPTTKHFFWTFLVPLTFAQAISEAPRPKMPKRMIVTMTAIITAATVGAVTGITNFFMNF